ncbi:MAG: hypothetical protein ACRD8W_22125, partial [Nitrososphaeraceae archaeon]
MNIRDNSISSILSSTETTNQGNDVTKGSVRTTIKASPRGYVRWIEVEKLAVRKYREAGIGIQYKDIIKEFHCSKAKAQR